jgi:hypothetical protein
MTKQNFQRIHISNIMAVEDGEVEVERDKLLLFGPNGEGKSSLIYALLRLLYATTGMTSIPQAVRAIEDPSSMVRRGSKMGVVEANAYRLEISSGGEEEVVANGRRYRAPVGLLHIERVGYVDACGAHIIQQGGPLSVDLCGAVEIRDAEVAEWVRDRLYVLPVSDIYIDRVKIAKTWIGSDRLSYGHRRAIGVVVATFGEPEVVAIEAFETGLHYDLVVDLLKMLDELRSFVVIESHIALAVKAALKMGWSVYYVDEGRFTKLSSIEELKKVAKKEAIAYAAVS